MHSGGVAAIAFSGGDGQLLSSLDLAQSPLLALWDWRRGELLASARAGRSRVLGLAFNPVTGALVSYGAGMLRFWSADGAKLKSRRELFEESGGAMELPSAASVRGLLDRWRVHALWHC